MGTASVSIGTGGGIVFLLWVLYHFIIESRHSTARRSVRARISQTITNDNRHDHRTLTVALWCLVLFVPSSEVNAQTSPQPGSEIETLQQKVIMLQHQLEEIQGELVRLKSPASIQPAAPQPFHPSQ
jgi:hypothetical protein